MRFTVINLVRVNFSNRLQKILIQKGLIVCSVYNEKSKINFARIESTVACNSGSVVRKMSTIFLFTNIDVIIKIYILQRSINLFSREYKIFLKFVRYYSSKHFRHFILVTRVFVGTYNNN